VLDPAPVAIPVASNKTLEAATEQKPKCCQELCQQVHDCAVHPRPVECGVEQKKCLASCHDSGCPRTKVTPKVLVPGSAPIVKAANQARQIHSEQCQDVCNTACLYQQTLCQDKGGLACEAQFPGCIPQCLAAYCPIVAERSYPVEFTKPIV
jgi:hypothetical protein